MSAVACSVPCMNSPRSILLRSLPIAVSTSLHPHCSDILIICSNGQSSDDSGIPTHNTDSHSLTTIQQTLYRSTDVSQAMQSVTPCESGKHVLHWILRLRKLSLQQGRAGWLKTSDDSYDKLTTHTRTHLVSDSPTRQPSPDIEKCLHPWKNNSSGPRQLLYLEEVQTGSIGNILIPTNTQNVPHSRSTSVFTEEKNSCCFGGDNMF